MSDKMHLYSSQPFNKTYLRRILNAGRILETLVQPVYKT